MTQTLQALQWVVGIALALLALVTVRDWQRHRGRSRRYLALTAILLAAVTLFVQLAAIIDFQRPLVTSLMLALFMGSAYALMLFRDSLVPLNRVVRAGLAALAVMITAAAIAVDYNPRADAAPQALAAAVNVALLLGWCLLVGVSIVRLWRVSAVLPAVQQARLRALTGGFSILILAILGIAATIVAPQNVTVSVAIECAVLVSVPLLAGAFAPPGWLRRSWREKEEVHFRAAVNDLLLYSPDAVTLARRGLEWPSRLLGGNGSLIAIDGRVLAFDGFDATAAQRLHAELEPQRRSQRRSLMTAAGPAAVVPLETRAGDGYLAVIAGPFTPLFGVEELMRLQQYGVSITVALDRVHLVEGVRRNAELLDLAYDAVFTWGFHSQGIQYWNRAAAEMYGHAAEDMIGRNPQTVLQTELPVPIQTIRDELAEHGHWEGEIVQLTRDGRRLHISARWALQRDAGGQPITVLEINRDISEVRRGADQLRRTRDEAEQASRAKSEYLSRMSHELRTPLAAMLGFSDLLDLREPRDDQRQAIDAIQRAGSHLLSLVNDVLDIARIESGRETLSLEPVDVYSLMGECQGLVSRSAAEHGIGLGIDVSPGTEGVHVRADRQRLNQVLLNLFTNAIKYSGDGRQVRGRVRAVGDQGVVIEVIDEGPGLDEDACQRLFQPFERLGAERSHVQGTGLGLALVRQLTAAMGGEVGVRSTVGQGSCFWVRLQRAGPSDAAAVVKAGGPAVLHDRSPASTVLYVEDNLATVGLIESIFALRPHLRLITAMQGGMGVQLAREHQPELVILDLHLPDLNGDEVMRRLRDDPRTAAIPIVVYSADATDRQIDRLLAEGAAAYLTKPARVSQFLDMLDSTVSRPQERAASRR